MRLMSTLSLLAAAVPFVGGGVSITVNVSVDSNVASVAVKVGNQSMSASANESATWAAWTVDANYTPTFTGVTEGYTGKWRVTADGLSTLSGGNGDAINLSQSYAGCSLSFYGEPNTYKVTFNRQGGSGDSSVTATYNEAMPAITPPTRTGYEFCAYTNSTGVTYYNADGTSARPWDKASEGTLFAQWRPAANNVTFDRRLGTGGTRSVVATYGEAMPPITLPVRTGYAFDAYTALPDGGTKYYNADGSSARTWNMTEATTLYARWKAVKPTVVLDAQGGSGGSSYVNPIYGCPMPTANMPHHTGWTFRGFTSQADGSGTRYYNAKGASARKWDCTSNTTLYAQWTVNEYSVALDPQGGGGGTPSVTAIYGVAMPMAEMPTRTGYEFRSYAALPDGGTKYYNADGTSAHDWNVAENATLYAQWKPLTYTVTFDRQSGSGGTSSAKATYDADMLTITPPTRTGYEFCAYTNAQGVSYYNAAGTGTTNWTVASSATLYAQWKPLTYTVTFDRSPGSGGTANTTATYDAPMPSVNPPARAGYDFNSYTNSTGTPYYDRYGASARNWDIPSDTTLHVEWKPCTYTITLDPHGGTDGTESTTATYSAAMPSITLPTRTGYEFCSYNTELNGSGTPYYNATGTSVRNWDKTSDATLYAYWTGRVYTVTLDPRPGSGGTESVKATYDAAMPTAEIPTRTGYDFNSYTNSTGTTYYDRKGSSAANWNIAADTTLYAEWKPLTYKITLNSRPGSGGTTSTNATYDAAMPTITPPTRTGYEFCSYTNSTGTAYYDHTGTSARNWDIAEATTLYAYWTGRVYTVTLAPQGGTGGATSTNATYDAAMPTITIPTRTGYEFCSYTNAQGTIYYDAAGASARNWNLTSDTALYAQWKALKYTITLDLQGGTNGTESATATFDAAMPRITRPTRTGYEFCSYNTEPNGAGTTYYDRTGASARNWDIPSDTTLYAYWTGRVYKVTLNQQGGSNGTESVKATYGSAMPAVEIPTRTGYEFCSYTNAQGIIYYDAAGASARNWNLTSDTALYAQWKPCTYTITLDQQGGTGGTTSTTATYDAAMPTAEMPTRTGYEFCSYTNSTGTAYYDHTGTSARTWDIPSDTTLYAYWTGRVYTVTLDQQSGSGGTTSTTATYDAAMPTAEIPTRTGYEFCSYTNAQGIIYYDADGTSVTNWNLTADTTLYAQWKPCTYTIKLDPQGGTGGTTSTTATYDAAMPTAEMPTRTGYEFCSYTNSTGTAYYNAAGTSATNWNIATNTTLYAQWKPCTYLITFDPRPGSGGTSFTNATFDAAMPSITPPVRDGYEFCAYTNSTGTTYYNADGTSATNWNIAADTTLYAYWNGRVYKVTLDARDPYGRGDGVLTNDVGEAVSVITNSYTVGEPWDLPTDPETFTNKISTLVFVGWTYTNSENVVTNLDLPSLVPPESAGITNLIAKWSNPIADALDVPTWLFKTFGKFGNVGALENYDDAKWIVCEDFESSGANVVQSVGLPKGEDKDSYIAWLTTELEGKGKLTFQWKFDAPDKDGMGRGNAFYFGCITDSETASELWSSTEKWEFKDNPPPLMAPVEGRPGWYQVEYPKTSADTNTLAWAFALEGGSNGGGTGYVDCVTWTPMEEFKYTVRFNANADGVTETMEPMICTYGVSTNLTACAFTLPGYTFDDWTNSAGRVFADGAEIENLSIDGEVNLYARWVVASYTITLDPQDGTDGPFPTTTATYGSAMSTITPPTRTGYEFCSYTNSTGTIYYNAAGASVRNWDLVADTTLYACWTGVTYAVTLDVRDPEGRGDGVLTNDVGEAVNVVTRFYTVGEPWDLPSPTNTNSSLSFGGWSYTNSVGEATDLALPSLVPPPSAGITNLIAKWSSDSIAGALDAPTLTFETFGRYGDGFSWEEYPTSWIVREDFEYPDTNVIQCVGLPTSCDDDHAYIAWLTTELTGAGTLTFQWKCEGAGSDNVLYFGRLAASEVWSSTEKWDFKDNPPPSMVPVDGRPGWYQVEYTKTSAGIQTFAWAFALEYGADGGGTAYIDCVTWTPDPGE